MSARPTIEDFQRDMRERRTSTPGDEERKQRILDNGLECLRRLHGDQTWEDWMGAGAAMMIVTEEAMAAVGASRWDKDNKRLVREFNRRWEEYEARLRSNYKPLTKQERWALREVMTNPEIGSWRVRLDGPEKRKLNHPNAVVNRWKASTRTHEPRQMRQPSPALRPVTKPVTEPVTKPAGHDHAALVQELAQAKVRIAAMAEELAQAKARIAELEAARETGKGGADVARLEAENARLKARIAELEVNAKRSRFSGRGYIMPEKQFLNLRLCLHPDVIAFLAAVAKDNPAHQLKVESLIKQFAKAAMTLTEFKDVLVNKAAEEKNKQSDAFWAAANWKRDEELRKKARAKQEAKSAAAKQRAAAKRATAQAQEGGK
jgi:hypothetical protein